MQIITLHPKVGQQALVRLDNNSTVMCNVMDVDGSRVRVRIPIGSIGLAEWIETSREKTKQPTPCTQNTLSEK